MFTQHQNSGYRESLPGIRQKTLAYGDRTLMVEFRLQKGAVLPLHKHPHEQTGYLVSGRMDLTIGNETRCIGPGDSWCVPGNTEHGANPVQDSVAILDAPRAVFCGMRVAAGIVVDETGFKVLSETDVETRWLACGPQDVDVEEAGLHRAPCILRSPKAGVF